MVKKKGCAGELLSREKKGKGRQQPPCLGHENTSLDGIRQEKHTKGKIRLDCRLAKVTEKSGK